MPVTLTIAAGVGAALPLHVNAPAEPLEPFEPLDPFEPFEPFEPGPGPSGVLLLLLLLPQANRPASTKVESFGMSAVVHQFVVGRI